MRICLLTFLWVLPACTALFGQQTLVKDISAGAGSSYPGSLAGVGNVLYFHATTQSSGTELWKSNGTAAGTVMVKDITPGSEGRAPQSLVNFRGTLFFTIGNGGPSIEIWRSDGTAAGTVMVKTLQAEEGDGTFSGFVPAGSKLYFLYNYKLWQSDGTSAGTVPVRDAGGKAPGSPRGLVDVNGTLFFRSFTETETESYYALWKTDGTRAGTVEVARGFSDEMTDFTNGDGILYFRDFLDRSWAVWRSDGTAAGTYTVSGGGTQFAPVYDLTYANGTLFFVSMGNTLSRYDPKTGQTTDLMSFDESEAGRPSMLEAVNGTLYFVVGTWLWKCEENGAKITRVKVLNSPGRFTAANGRLYFVDSAPGSTAPPTLWVSDGTSEGTKAVASSAGMPAIPTALTPVNGSLYYAAETPATGRELWQHEPSARPGNWRINAGGNAFRTADARAFSADAYFSGGIVSLTTNAPIAGTADDCLYQTGRHGSSFSYNLPTGNGSYDVVLHFSETYFGNIVPGGAGSRKFHVNTEGVRRLTDYDIFARAGGALRAVQETFRVHVTDGTLNIAFLKGAANYPAIKAIEVLPAGSALTINAGGVAFTASGGRNFSADSYYASGRVSVIPGGDILNTTDDSLYHNMRYGMFSYALPSGNGTFNVTLHFAETYWGSRVPGGVGSRKFNVYLEGVKRLSDYDIFARAGGAMRAVKETVQVTVRDGVLNLHFVKGPADNPAVSAIEVTPVAVAARTTAAEEGTAGARQVHLFPNPVQGRLMVRLPFPAGAVRATAVLDAKGTVRMVNAHAVTAHDELTMNVGALPHGLYFLRIDTGSSYELTRFVKQ